MKKIIALGGSNSQKSINKALATYVANQVKNVEICVLDLNDFDLPLYGIDLETSAGVPADAIRLNSLMDSADGFVVFCLLKLDADALKWANGCGSV